MGMIKEKIILFYGGGRNLFPLWPARKIIKPQEGHLSGGAGRMYYDINYLLKFMIRYHEGGKGMEA